MKKVACYFFCLFLWEISHGQNMNGIYSGWACGMNYTEAHVLLSQKLEFNGAPYSDGLLQPAPMVISGIPSGAVIEKAFLWWDLTGPDSTGSAILQNPAGLTDTFPGLLTGRYSGCWAIGSSAFRADVTSSISSNGTYLISGLPVDSVATDSADVNGATLFIVYSNPTAAYVGHISIYDGYIMVKQDTVTQTISGISAPDTSDLARAFMQISYFYNKPENTVKMNNGPFQSVVQDFWDYEERSTLVTAGQTTSEFGIRTPNDCANWLMMGLYWQYNHTVAKPAITRSGDTLTSSTALSYQWNIGGSPIAGAVNKVHIATKAGYYTVTTSDSTGCLAVSDSTYIQCIASYKPPVLTTPGKIWTTDKTMTTLQWYFGSLLINGATDTVYTAAADGYYSVEGTDSLGCKHRSDSVFVAYVGMAEWHTLPGGLRVYPNPGTGIFTVWTNGRLSSLTIYNILGEIVFSERNVETPNLGVSTSPETFTIDLSGHPPGIYFLVINRDGEMWSAKLIMWE